MVKLFQDAGLNDYIRLIRWTAVPLDDQRILTYTPRLDTLWEKRSYSNFLTFKDAWEHFGGSEDGCSNGLQAGDDDDQDCGHQDDWSDAEDDSDSWALFFEDDISFHPEIRHDPDAIYSAIQRGFELGQRDGFVYLGICHGHVPKLGWSETCCSRANMSKDSSSTPAFDCREVHTLDAIRIQRGCGSCLHAYALSKHRAQTLFRDIVPRPNMYGHPESIYMDHHARMWNSPRADGQAHVPLWIVGANLVSPANPTHFGICYQEDGLPSSIVYPDRVYEMRRREKTGTA
jgi:hypothetical protein